MDCSKCEKKPCCENYFMPVEVTSDFIFRLAERFNMKPEDAFNEFCDVAVFSKGLNIDTLGVSLKSPCPFFDNGCKIHDIKPVTCIIFPAQSMSNRLGFEQYPCLNGEMEEMSAESVAKNMTFYDSLMFPEILELDERILYKHKRPFVSEMRLIHKYPSLIDINNPDKWSINSEILKKELGNEPSKQTLFTRIRMIKPEDREKIANFNKIYFEKRKGF